MEATAAPSAPPDPAVLRRLTALLPPGRVLTGPAHLAAAAGVPLVVLFGESDPVIWAPWRAHAQSVVAGGPMNLIPVERVQQAIDTLGVPA